MVDSPGDLAVKKHQPEEDQFLNRNHPHPAISQWEMVNKNGGAIRLHHTIRCPIRKKTLSAFGFKTLNALKLLGVLRVCRVPRNMLRGKCSFLQWSHL